MRSTIHTRSVAELNEAEHRVQYPLAAKKKKTRATTTTENTHTGNVRFVIRKVRYRKW